MNNSQLVIFDFDGVLVNTFLFAYEINRQQSGITQEEYRKKFEGNFYQALPAAGEHAIDKDFDFFAHYTPQLMDSTPVASIIKIIQKLSEKYILTIVSSTLTKSIDDYLEKIRARSYFQEILGPDIDKSKVNKINGLLKKYSKLPSDAVFVTDTVGDIQEAEQCGVKAVAVTWGYHPRITLEKANPFRIIDTPEELEIAIGESFSI